MTNSVQMPKTELVLRVAAATVGACEVGANAGPYVERVQKRTGNGRGDAWCASYVADVGICALGDGWPAKRSGRVADVVAWAVAKGCSYVPAKEGAGRPQPGDLFALYFPSLKRHAHIGFVTAYNADGTISTVEGNTNADGSREGWLVANKRRTLKPQDRLLRWVDVVAGV